MSRYVLQNLHRQKQAIYLLSHLLDEEFHHLGKGDPQSVATVEFSIQELLRQIAEERRELKQHVMDLDPSLPALRDLPLFVNESDSEDVQALLREIDRQEQDCARKAAQNAVTAQGLMDQNQALLDYLTSQIIPENGNTYSRRGKWHRSDGPGALLHGRM